MPQRGEAWFLADFDRGTYVAPVMFVMSVQVKSDKSHVPAPVTIGPATPGREHTHTERDHDAKPPASIVEDKRWEMPCTD